MPKAYRIMKAEGDPPKPVVGESATKLGIRERDLKADENGDAVPGVGGLSVFSSIAGIGRRIPDRFPPDMVPKRLHGSERVIGATGPNSLRVFRLGEGDYEQGGIAPGLCLVPDGEVSPDHGTIQPDQTMPMDEYRQAIADTKELWEDGENDA
ncbi:hypothetical protein LF1_07020 [Rubripirellula obstinata]|uniref:Uncharacterized protein n=1 Tax=Rubripirellula obstinata TaxID=406547 RepID=A0A5B1CCA0_9BACT|nr:hypothetical protein [Rubripirellula obstinata]KAA1258186.1 hypothetical protein LF1_07020 [Rubripirellula obstinata]